MPAAVESCIYMIMRALYIYMHVFHAYAYDARPMPRALVLYYHFSDL